MLVIMLLAIFFLIVIFVGLKRTHGVKWFWPLSRTSMGEKYSVTEYLREYARQLRIGRWVVAIAISTIALLFFAYLFITNI